MFDEYCVCVCVLRFLYFGDDLTVLTLRAHLNDPFMENPFKNVDGPGKISKTDVWCVCV